MQLYAAEAARPVQDALSDVARFVPKLLIFLVILLVGWFIAKAARAVVDKILERVHFDRAVERGGVGRLLARSRYDASDLVAAIVYYGLLLVTLEIAFSVWGPNPVSDLIHDLVAWLPKALVAIIIVVVAAAVAGAVRDLVANTLSALSYGRLLANVAAAFIIGLGVIAALNQIGVATSVTTPVLIAVLATIGGVIVVGVGGGLVRPMQARWERWLGVLETELPQIREQVRQAPPVGEQPVATADPETPTAGTVPPARPVRERAPRQGGSVPGGDPAPPVATRPPAPPVADDPEATMPIQLPGQPPRRQSTGRRTPGGRQAPGGRQVSGGPNDATERFPTQQPPPGS